jgi:hypothetical protein
MSVKNLVDVTGIEPATPQLANRMVTSPKRWFRLRIRRSNKISECYEAPRPGNEF